MTRTEANNILTELTETDSLLLHARTVAHVMEAYATKLGQDAEHWYCTGLLHDADYEKFPEKHPDLIVERLRSLGEEEMAHAISAHYTKWNVPYETLLDKALLACDELTGFIIAVARVRPGGMDGLSAKSVKKKLKSKGFAAKVERDEIDAGIELLGVEPTDHINFIIEALQSSEELKEALA